MFRDIVNKSLLLSFFFKFLLMLVPVLLSSTVQAKTLVLIHGFLSDSTVWRSSGFTQPLSLAGYNNGGNISFNPFGVIMPPPTTARHVFHTLDLPSQSNLQIQEGILKQYLDQLYLQRQEPITLIGHSAGGVLARLYTLGPARVPINGLITIASPHLGTPTANVAYLAGNSPIGMMASMVGGEELQNARGLLSDLQQEKPHNFLYWMNHQKSPNILYASIIRRNKTVTKFGKFDFIVPPRSQDMNNVWSLKGRSGVALSNDNHFLNGKDALIILEVLKNL